MKKLLRSRDLLLLSLAGIFDLYNDLKDPFGAVGGAYENLYGWVPKRFRKTNTYHSVRQSLKTGYIEKIIKNGQPYLRLTSKGKEKIKRDFSLVRWQNQKWDRKWRIVIFDIEEKERFLRDSLRKKLRELGFGMIQESTWISPYDVAIDFREFVKSIGLSEKVFVMEVNHLLAGDPVVLASKIWKLKEINQAYQELLEMLNSCYDRDKDMTGTVKKSDVVEKYLEILKADPCLPKELLPENWVGEEVKTILSR